MRSPDLQRLLRIQDYCYEIEKSVARCSGSYEVFCEDADLQRSIAFSVLQIGELVAGLSEEYRASTHNSIPWGLIKAMRNIIAHDYGNVDLETVWDAATKSVPELKEFCRNEIPQ